jgi:hypothetical protein
MERGKEVYLLFHRSTVPMRRKKTMTNDDHPDGGAIQDARARAKNGAHRNGGARHRCKGNRVEREIVDLHKAIGIHAERVRSRVRPAIKTKVTTSTSTSPAATKRHWLPKSEGSTEWQRVHRHRDMVEREYDALFLRRDHADPLVVLPWRVWTALNAPAGFLGTARGILRRVANRRDA